jgi:site-specific recombinase XerD
MRSANTVYRPTLPGFEWEAALPIARAESVSAPLDGLVDAYLLACQTEGMSPNTVRWYAQKLRTFVDHLRGNGIPPVLPALAPDTVRAFVASLQARAISEFTVRGYVQVLKGLATWLVDDGYLDRHPLSRVALPRVPRYLIKPLDDTEAMGLLRAVDDRSPRGTRDMALVLLLLDTGMRLGEAAGLTLTDGDEALTEGMLKVRGKGARERYLPVGKAAGNILRRYLQVHRPLGPSDALFVSDGGRPLAAEGLRQIVRRAAARAGIAGVHPHRLRHTFARKFLMNGGDAMTLQRILGHSTLEMVRRYVSLDTTDIRRRHAECSPGDRFWLARHESPRRRPSLRVVASGQ